jgi:penicillin amidase
MRLTSVLGFVLALSLFPSGPLADPDRGDGRKVTIVRDERGVPHVHAATVEALFYGAGYASAQDRLWQAETLRRAGTGTLAEWFGPGSLASDVQTRTLFGPPSRRAALFAAASPEVRVVFESFTAGMNAWIAEATASGKLPLEYAAFGVAPRPWTVDDSLAVFFLLGSQFGWFGFDELDNAAAYMDLVGRLGPAEGARAFADTHWIEDPSATTTDPAPGAGGGRPGRGPQGLPDAVEDAAREHRERGEAAEKARAEVGLRRGPMSNAILVGPRMSADGRALLLGGPQMGYGAPQINHEMGLHGGGFEVTGMMIAGMPLVPIGVGRGYAWSLTSGGSDNSDIFTLALNPSNPGQYRYLGGWRDLDCRVETIPVAGTAPRVQPLCRSVQGPVIAVAGGTAYAFNNATFGNELSSFEGWIGLGQVRSFAEFRERVAAVAYNFNVFYADAERNIAHFHAGRIPVRAPGANVLFPQPGDGSSDWQGTIPFDRMPHSVNPARGWLVNWNNKPGPDWPNTSAGFWAWGPVHRGNTLRRILESTPPHSMTLDTLARVNRQAGLTTDSPSGDAHTVVVTTLLGDLVDAVDASADPRLPAALEALRRWDLLQTDEDADGFYDSPAVALFNTWWQKTVESVLTPKLGPGVDRTVQANLIYRLLQGDDAALPVQADYLGGRTLGDAVTRSLADALDALAAQYGTPDLDRWLQARAEIFWAPGGIGSVHNTLWMNRGTYNQLVHLGRGEGLRALNVIAPGQSGDFRSPHFADQLPLYESWTYKPMRLTREDQLRHAESVTRLRVP